MKFFLTLLICLNGFSFLNAQNYYAIRNDGQLPQGYYLDKVYDSDKTVLLTQPSAETLSSENFIPFNFYFYNKAYTKYKVSDNGYLTFNTSSTTSELPDTNLPNNSISVFGQDFKLQALPSPNEGIGVQVFAYTVGQAPNRRHIIQYHGLSLASNPLDQPITNASIYAFAIILHEGNEGRFDVTYSPYGDKAVYGSIGCVADSGQNKYLLNDTLNKLPFQFSFDISNYIVYQFYYGQHQDYDLVIKDLAVSKIYPVNAIVNFSGKMSNWGKKSIQSYYLNYSINAQDTISFLIDQINLKPNGEGGMNFSHPISWLSGSAGSLNEVNFWLSMPNGQADMIPANSHFQKTVLRNNNNYIIDRNIVFEEGTGAWCGYCPGAHLIIAEAVKIHGDRVIPVSYHFDDSMSNPDALSFLSRYVFSYPDALLDRKVFLGSNNTWLTEVSARLNTKVPVEVSIEMKSFNVQTRVLAYRVKVRFTDYWYGKLNIGSIVTENGVRGNANPNLWSQNNYYSKDHGSGGVGGSSHPLYNELEFMDGYIHQGTHKASPGGVWGKSGIIPDLVAPDDVYFADFSYVLPPVAKVNYSNENNTDYCSTLSGDGRNVPTNIQFVGFLEEFDADYNNRPIINATSSPLWDLTGIEIINHPTIAFNVFPNPVKSNLTLKFEEAISESINIQILNASGQIVFSLENASINSFTNQIEINTSLLASGIYLLKVSKLDGSYSVRNILLEN